MDLVSNLFQIWEWFMPKERYPKRKIFNTLNPQQKNKSPFDNLLKSIIFAEINLIKTAHIIKPLAGIIKNQTK